MTTRRCQRVEMEIEFVDEHRPRGFLRCPVFKVGIQGGERTAMSATIATIFRNPSLR